MLNDRDYEEQMIREHYHELTRLLIEREMTITTMESATSGQIASLITDTEGASAILKGAFITYSNEAKIKMGVPAGVIEAHTVYSRETAEAMARACMETYRADIGIGVTGTMGNADPANPEASVPGQVYFAIGMRERGSKDPAAEPAVESFYIELAPQPSRLMYKLAVAEEVFRRLAGKLT
jgi:PncC family amidohydrolase